MRKFSRKFSETLAKGVQKEVERGVANPWKQIKVIWTKFEIFENGDYFRCTLQLEIYKTKQMVIK